MVDSSTEHLSVKEHKKKKVKKTESPAPDATVATDKDMKKKSKKKLSVDTTQSGSETKRKRMKVKKRKSGATENSDDMAQEAAQEGEKKTQAVSASPKKIVKFDTSIVQEQVIGDEDEGDEEQEKVKKKKTKGEKEVSEEKVDKQLDKLSDLKKKEKVKKEKKKKREKAPKEPKESAAELAVKYLEQWRDSRGQWKFQKVRQTWLLKNMFETTQVAEESFALLLEYCEGLKGRARDDTLAKAQSLLDKHEEQPDSVPAEQYERARQVLQNIS